MEKFTKILSKIIAFVALNTVILALLMAELTLFGVRFHSVWHIILFVAGFILADRIISPLVRWLVFFMVKNRLLVGFWQVTLCRAMMDFLFGLFTLLILRKLDGIEIGAVAAYCLAFSWGLIYIAFALRTERKLKKLRN